MQGGQLTPINLVVETEYHRAAPGGTGGTKCIGNYSPVLKTQLEAKAAGYSDVVYLDARENKYIEEVSSCNIFVVKGRRISTPGLRHGLVLPSRRLSPELTCGRSAAPFCLASLARASSNLPGGRGTRWRRELSPWRSWPRRTRCFAPCVSSIVRQPPRPAHPCSAQGTAVVVVPVGSTTHGGKKTVYSDGQVGRVAQELYNALTDLQSERAHDPQGWLVEVD